MKEEKTEGIVLRSQEYQEMSRIISVYTPLRGLVQIFVKKISNARLMALTTPFTCAEFHFAEGRSNLLRFQESTILDEHLLLRVRLQSLKAAGEMTAALLHLLMPESADPPLYALYKAYLKQIPEFKDTSLLLTSFYLKLLKYEGHLNWSDFSSEDRHVAESLASVRTFDTLKGMAITPALQTWSLQKSKSYLHVSKR